MTWPQSEWALLRARLVNYQAVVRLGYGGYFIFDVVDTANRIGRRSNLDKVDVAPYRNYLRELATKRPEPDKNRPRKHIIYLQLESVDGLVIGGRKNGEPMMPFLEGLATANVFFTNAIDNTASGRTTDGEFLVLTSQVPVSRPPVYVTQKLDKIPSMPRVLEEVGYRSVSIHGFNGVFWHRREAHTALGYNEMLFEDDLDLEERIGWGFSDREVLAEAARMIAASEQPLFLHVITLTNHHPYDYISKEEGRKPERIEAEYLRSVRYLDDCIAEFFSSLEEKGVLKDCLIAIYGDHDSAINEELEIYLDDELPRLISDTVPLVMVGFDQVAQRIDELAGLQDVPVMILEEIGIPVPLTFTGNGWHQWGRTVGPQHGSWKMEGDSIEPWIMAVDQETLTLLAINHPEKLLEP